MFDLNIGEFEANATVAASKGPPRAEAKAVVTAAVTVTRSDAKKDG